MKKLLIPSSVLVLIACSCNVTVDKSERDPNDSGSISVHLSVDSSDEIETNIHDANIKIDSSGVKINATDEHGQKVKVNIDKDGVEIKTKKN